MDRLPDDTASVRELEVIAAAMRDAFDPQATAPPPGTTGAERLQALADAFPGYELVREIHRGGQGIVYQALQKSTRRQVAIKVMRDGPFADAHDRARFEREVQILAQLDHPNVVGIHDSGVAHDRFYYVMDYIPGRPLDEYVLEEDPPINALLALFKDIADAVNAAHLRGVTHRDLKPSNILVVTDEEGTKPGSHEATKLNKHLPIVASSLRGSVASPRVLDFGLAKLAAPAPSSPSTSEGQASSIQAMTISGQFVGSLPWASPEQAEGAPSKIDLRTDVYSLGVILYQLLTGRFPYPVVGAMRDVVENILTVDPVRPSTIRSAINDEVETIVLKCMSKDRDRRYQSAGELSRDIGRYLKGEPIEAKRDSGWYVLKKTVSRYKVPAFVAAAFVVVLISAVYFQWVQSVRALVAERSAVQAKNVAMQFVDRDLLRRLARGEGTAKSLLDAMARQNDTAPEDPKFAADIHKTYGDVYFAIGDFPTAVDRFRKELALRRALQPDSPEGFEALVGSLNNLGESLRERGGASTKDGPSDYQAAANLHQEALALAQAHLGDDDPETSRSLHDLGAAYWWLNDFITAQPLYERALELRERSGVASSEAAATCEHLAACLDRLGQGARAEELYRKAISIRDALPSTVPFDRAVSMYKLGYCFLTQRRYAEAEPQLRDTYAAMLAEAPPGHPWVTRVQHSLGTCLGKMGRLVEADDMLRDALAAKQTRLVPDALSTARTKYELANVLWSASGDLAEAEQLCREALELQKEHPDAAATRELLVRILQAGD